MITFIYISLLCLTIGGVIGYFYARFQSDAEDTRHFNAMEQIRILLEAREALLHKLEDDGVVSLVRDTKGGLTGEYVRRS